MYIIRLIWLLIFGLLHAIFIWDGDILATYALIAIFLFLLRKLKPKTMIILSIILFVTFIGINFANLIMSTDGVTADIKNSLSEYEEDINFYKNATYMEITASRIETTLEVDSPWLNLLAPFYLVFERLDVLGAFLFGAAVGKLGWFNQIEEKLDLWRKIFQWAMPLGLGINILGGYLTYFLAGENAPAYYYDTGLFLFQLGAPPLTLGYISAIVLLGGKLKSLSVFAPAGKMALTVYLTQSIILTLIFYSYGLGLIGTIGPALALLLALAIYTIQLAFSNYWIKNFRFGPFEWLWRSLTYRRLQPMKLEK